MKTNSLSKEIENLNKKNFSIKQPKKFLNLKVKTPSEIIQSNKSTTIILPKKFSTSTKTPSTPSNNLPALRKVAIAKQRTQIILLVALFVSCFSLSVFIGFIGPFLLFR